jgi:putative spermidine/putrescine transport system permease protein
MKSLHIKHPRRLLAAAFGMACVLPAVFILALSFVKRWEAGVVLPAEWHVAHWRAAAEDTSLLQSIVVSVLISSGVAAISTAIGFVTSHTFALHPHKHRVMLLAYIPFAMSPVIFGASAHIVFIKLGLAGSIAGVIMAQTMFGCAFAVIILSSFWNPQIEALQDLARTLGASHNQVLRRVLLPVAREFLLLAFVQTFLLSWFQYGLTLVIGGGVVQTLPLLVYSAINEANPYYAAVSASILVLPAIVMVFINKRFLLQRL